MSEHSEFDQGSPRIERGLEALFGAPNPEAAFVARLEQQLLTRVRTRSQRGSELRFHLRPTTRSGWVLLVLALCLALGAGAWAVSSIVDRLFRVDPGLNHVGQAGLGQDLALSQMVDGVTVTLERAYADANRIAIGLTVRGSYVLGYDLAHVALSDTLDRTFPLSMGMGVKGQSDVLQLKLPSGAGAHVLSFDASALRGAPSTLDLHLVVEVARSPMPLSQHVIGPFIFDFSLPLNPGKVVDVQQRVTAASVDIELKQVVVTPSETQVLLCLGAPSETGTSWGAVSTLRTETGQADGVWVRSAEEGCTLHGFLPPLYDQPGEWTLTVTELVVHDRTQLGEPTRIAGPWVFLFHVP
jgi:hypothetical protein